MIAFSNHQYTPIIPYGGIHISLVKPYDVVLWKCKKGKILDIEERKRYMKKCNIPIQSVGLLHLQLICLTSTDFVKRTDGNFTHDTTESESLARARYQKGT